MAVAALLAFGTSCSEEEIQGTGEGSLHLTTAISSDVKVESRADDAELRESCMVWISNSEGKLVRRYEGLDNVPESIDLVNGSYVAEAWAGDSVSASFDKRYFYGHQPFEINSAATEVKLTAKIANVVTSVVYADGLDEVLSNYTMTVGHSRGSLMFDGRDDRKGYFMMPSTDTDLAYELRGTQINGSEFVLNGTIANAQRATEYVLNVYYEQQTTEIGGAVLTIRVDKHEVEAASELQIIAAPKIEGYGFELATPIMSEEGLVGRRSVYISSATTLKDVILEGDILAERVGNRDIDLLQMKDAGKTALAAAGINFSNKDVEEGSTLMQLNFEEEFTNALTNGNYDITISATDAEGKTSTATLSFLISDAPVQTVAVAEDDVDYFTVTLSGVVSKDGVENIGFKYKAAAEADWSYIEGEVASRSYGKGTKFTATLTNLQSGTTYQYAAVNDDFTAAIETFTTKTEYQLENAGFEDWDSGSIILPKATNAETFWDCGNHGSSTMGINVTQPSEEKVHSGKYSAKLRSQFVGMGIIGKFAAGNIFVGKYLKTEGTDGLIGFGREFNGTPQRVTFWMHYTPGIVEQAKQNLKKGDTDQGAIFIALTDDNMETVDGNSWPAIVRTKDKKFFNSNASNIIAYGELILTEKTAGDDLVQATIELNYRRPEDKNKVTNIIFVASASRYGDYFEGGEGSTLYLDDIHLEY